MLYIKNILFSFCFRSIFVISFVLLLGNVGFGQGIREAMASGDTLRARLSWKDRYHDPHVLSFYLGYIDTNVASVQEVLDNMKVGYMPSNSKYIIDSCSIGFSQKGCDYCYNILEKGNKISVKNMVLWKELCPCGPFHVGTVVYMAAKMHRQGSSFCQWYETKLKIQ